MELLRLVGKVLPDNFLQNFKLDWQDVSKEPTLKEKKSRTLNIECRPLPKRPGYRREKGRSQLQIPSKTKT